MKCEHCGTELNERGVSHAFPPERDGQQWQHTHGCCRNALKTQLDEVKRSLESIVRNGTPDIALWRDRALGAEAQHVRDVLLMGLATAKLAEAERERDELKRARLPMHPDDVWVLDQERKLAKANEHAKRLLSALGDAATSLETISVQAGVDEYMTDVAQIRGYAHSRAVVARAALAQSADAPETFQEIVARVEADGPLTATVLAQADTPETLHELASRAAESSAKRNAELEAMTPDDRDKAIAEWAKKLGEDSVECGELETK